MRKIYAYTENDVCPIDKFFSKTNVKIRNKLKFQFDHIKDEHNVFCEPYIKHFSIEKYKQLYEFRIKAAGIMVRVIFYEKDNEITLLHAFIKKDRKDTEKALEHALKILNSTMDENGNIYENLRKEWTG